MKKFISARLVAIQSAGAAVMLAASSVHAALPSDVKTALEGAKTDGMEAATLVLVASAAIFGIMLIRRVLR